MARTVSHVLAHSRQLLGAAMQRRALESLAKAESILPIPQQRAELGRNNNEEDVVVATSCSGIIASACMLPDPEWESLVAAVPPP